MINVSLGETMSFYSKYEELCRLDIEKFQAEVSNSDIERIIAGNSVTEEDFLALLSKEARPYLEEMATKANAITRNQFGYVMGLYTPMYLSNYCSNHCLYCGFNCKNDIYRSQLTLEEVSKEAKAIAESGLKHILILTGDAPQIATVDYLCNCCEVLKEDFSSISIEIYAMDESEYGQLIAAGVDGLTIYQESYNKKLYERLHPKGPKKNFLYRLNAPERGCKAGMRSVNIGALLGLDADWRKEVFFTGMHALWLQNQYPEVEVSISLPRMRPHAGKFQPACVVDDRAMVQIMTAFRLLMPRCGINISTRESREFRDNIMDLGVTRMSAGVSTAVGGHSKNEEKTNQFEISDTRSVEEMCKALGAHQLQPIFKDWEQI